ncbi:hypothetical protein BY996DRAFT_6436430 [Phakopsora pachyrhizi]|nr:hypothetical protein BY996DRAFT_6436430 [Phakopsora pachyrhizi]
MNWDSKAQLTNSRAGKAEVKMIMNLSLENCKIDLKRNDWNPGVGDIYLKIGTQLVEQLEEQFYCKDEKGDNFEEDEEEWREDPISYNKDVETMDLLAGVMDGVAAWITVVGIDRQSLEDGGDGGGTAAKDRERLWELFDGLWSLWDKDEALYRAD